VPKFLSIILYSREELELAACILVVAAETVAAEVALLSFDTRTVASFDLEALTDNPAVVEDNPAVVGSLLAVVEDNRAAVGIPAVVEDSPVAEEDIQVAVGSHQAVEETK
jgi:hypothetical protein